MQGLQAAAKEHNIHVHVGIHVPVSVKSSPSSSSTPSATATPDPAVHDTTTKLLNRTVWIQPTGTIDSAHNYDKLHLFDYAKANLRESAHTQAGTALTPPFDSPVGRIGSLICFDLRFPEPALALALGGPPQSDGNGDAFSSSSRRWAPAQVLTYPSAFTVPTGEAHWEPLLRARAIEGQCWVVAAAQVGWHSGEEGTGRVSYGRSMVVDPWGRVKVALPCVKEVQVVDGDSNSQRGTPTKMVVEEGAVGALGLVDIDLGEWERVRERLPLVRRK